MEVLILGGTQLMGRLLVEKLLGLPQYDLTLFNRGKTNAHLFPNVKRITGDRETEEIDQIFSQYWDIIVDFSSYHPNSLEKLIKSLKGKVGRYIYISTISTFPYEMNGIKEESCPISPCTATQRDATKVTNQNYGPKKAECERIIRAEDWLDAIILRPSIVYGQYDYTQRLYYWLYRVKTQDRILIPDDASELSNFTFVDDMVEIILASMKVEKHQKVYITTTHEPNSLKEKLAIMSHLLGTQPTYITVPQEKILAADLKGGLPCWRTNDKMRYDHSRMLADFGIKLHTFEASIEKMIAYHDEMGWEEGSAGIRVSDEQDFLSDVDFSR